ncbi:MAG: YihY/virulence factor BrkB family protein [Acidobacteria bacterium]|nr:YihY/virulence factor BrkB family protein [Acidobacteriota bacterium]MDA1233678.1 YihY/virulence factor BrkB family protein [Acidobacteriota bacterium]
MSMSLLQTEDEDKDPSSSTVRMVFEPTIRYWFGLDSHVYAMAIAANVLLGFFPFMLLMLSLASFAFPASNATQAILLGLKAFLPEDAGLVDFVVRNLQAEVATRGAAPAVSVILLLVAANGIFMPLEVAQNRLWRFPANRNYAFNQLISLCIGATSMVVALLSSLFAAFAGPILFTQFPTTFLTSDIAMLWGLRTSGAIATTIVLLLVYWLLPNGPVPFRRALTTAFVVALLIEGVQSAYAWVWPWLGLRGEYGPFFISVTLMLWGFLAAMVVLAGAEACARR